MEFPGLGEHCFVKSCNKLDFLPMKCDACLNIFCKDHFSYTLHNCEKAFLSIQVPVCPLCNNPVPSKRGEQPDIAVGEHIDRDCKSDPAVAKRKVYTNKCSVNRCKQKEVIRITCDKCHKSYCLKHRYPDDHNCQEQKALTAAQSAGNETYYQAFKSNQEDKAKIFELSRRAAAMARSHGNKKSSFKFPWYSNQSCASSVDRRHVPNPLPEVSVNSVQGRLSEDEALALALQNSMRETKPRSVQEQEDRLLAEAIANSQRGQAESSASHGNREKSCCVS